MIPRSEQIVLWGAGNYVTGDIHELAQAAIPYSAKTYLTEVGLPRSPGFLLSVDFDSHSVLQLSEFAILKGVQPESEWANYWRIASGEYGAQICIESRSGKIFAVDLEGEVPTTYINQDIGRFGDSLYFYRTLIGSEDDLEEPTDEAVREFRQALSRTNSTALSAPDNWWSSVLYELEQT